MSRSYDVIIVGGGPAGLFAAFHLCEHANLRVLLIEKGHDPRKRKCPINEDRGCLKCQPCNILCGIGGAGLFSDGKLNYIPKLGKTDLHQFMNRAEAQALIDDTEAIYDRFGMDGPVYPTDMAAAREYRKQAKRFGIDLLLIKQKHLGSDVLPGYIADLSDYIRARGVAFRTGEEVLDILVENERVRGVVTGRGEYFAPNVILSPGRVGADWVGRVAERHGIGLTHRGIEVGIRVEVHNDILQDLCRIIYDPTFFIQTGKYDDQTRTFCTNYGGFVAQETYANFVCVNGHAFRDRKSENSNFAFLSKVVLTEPVTDNQAYGEAIGNLASLIGGGRPILQRFGDLTRGRRSTWNRVRKGYIEPTLTNVVCGDIAMALPERILTNLVEGLRKLNDVVPGVANDETLLYAPEIKFFATQVETGNDLQTRIRGLYMAGDGPGVAGNIVSASATGLIPARAILAGIAGSETAESDPARPESDSETPRRRAVCTMDCPDTCALLVEERGDGTIRLHGDPDHPFTEGFVCAKIRRHVERLRSPDRILYPLLRDGAGWRRIGWDEAMDRCAAEIGALRDEPSAILHIKGEGAKGVLKQGVARLFATLGATRLRGTLCDGAGFIAGVQDFGSRKNNDPADLLNAAHIVNWGRDLSRSSVHIAQLVRKARKGGARVLTVSPGGDGNAAFSDGFIRIRPGTDRFLAAAALRRMLVAGSFHPEVPDRVRNWEAFRTRILDLDETELLSTCEVSPERLDALSAAYADRGPTATLVGAGLQRYGRGGENVRHINALALLSGNMGRAGGGSQFHLHSLGCFNLDWTRDPEKKRSRAFREPTVGPEILAADPPIRMIWVNGTNTVNQAPDATATARAFERTPFVVVADAFMNDTAARADLILPSALMLEQEDIVSSFLHGHVQHVPAVFDPPGEARDDYAIARALGLRLDPPVELPDPETAMAASLDSPELDIDLPALRRRGSVPLNRPALAYEGMNFDHPDGRARLVPALSPEPDPPPDYPLRLLTLVRREAIHSQIPRDRQPDGENDPPRAWTAPDCPALRDLDPERPVDLVSPLGRMRVRLETLPGLHPGAVVYRRGDWMRFGGGVNRIVEARLTDLGGGAAYYDQYVRLENG